MTSLETELHPITGGKAALFPFWRKVTWLPSNYRGISLTSTADKIFNKMILLRIRPEIEKVLRKNQNGFRPGRSTTTQVLSLRRLIEGITEKQLTAILLFVDFSKAFDSIHRGTMLSILRAYGIPEVLIRSIGALYEDTTSTIRTPDGDTDFFQVLAGVLQGDTLAPYLIIIVLDYVLRTSIDENSENWCRLRGLMDKASDSESEDPGSIPASVG